jgi:CheY-like chemotaxis protein
MTDRPKLLVVDDDEGIRTQLKYALRDDFTLFFAADRPAALAAMKSSGPELVSLDLGLPPDQDGADEGLKASTRSSRRRRAPRWWSSPATATGSTPSAPSSSAPSTTTPSPSTSTG